MPRQRHARTRSLLDQVCDRLAFRARTRHSGRAGGGRPLGFEWCERRDMLAGATIMGTVSPGTMPAAGVTIDLFQDNGSLTFNPSDPLYASTTSANPSGAFTFTNIPDNRYYIEEQLPAGYTQVSPTSPAFYTVDVIDGQVYSGTIANIDNFDDPNPADSYTIGALNPNPTLFNESGSTTNLLGGARNVVIDVHGTPFQGSAEGFVGTSGAFTVFNFGTGPSAPGSEAVLQYSGSDTETLTGTMLSNAMALNADLTNGGTNNALRFDFDFLQNSGGNMPVTITATSPGASATFTGSIVPNGGGFSFSAPLALFVPTLGFTFTDVTSLKVDLNNTAVPDTDFQINRIVGADLAPNLTFVNSATPSLSITKTDSTLGTDNPGSVLPGQPLTYTVTVSNAGPGSVSGAAVVDAFPPPFTGGTYTVQLNGGATDTMPTGSGSIDDSVSLPVGASIVYTVTGTVSSTAMTAFTNSASVTPPGGTTQTAMDTVSPILLSITKTDSTLGTANPGSVLPGHSLTYTVTVTNTGPGSVSGAAVVDAFPPPFTGGTYTVQLNGGATDTMPTGSGSINDSVSLPVGASIVYTVTGTVSSTAMTAFTNSASVTPPGGSTQTAMDTVSPILLSITKTDSTLGTANPGNVLPGHSLTYTVTVTNTGPGSVSGASVMDTFPPPFTGGTYTVQLNGGATDTMPTGSGSIDDSVSLPTGSSIVYTVVGTVSSTAMTAFTNSASVTPPGGSTQTAMDTVSPILVSITKTDSTLGTTNPGSVLPGHSLTYTVTVTNTGSGSVSGAAVVDAFPPPFTGGTYTVQLNGGATDTMPTGSGSINDSVSLPVSASIVYTVVGTVSSAATTAFTNTASVTPPGGSTQTAMDTVSPILLSITKTDSTLGTANPGSVLPGHSLTYTVTVTNTGPGSVSGAAVVDAFPPLFTGGTYTVQLNGGATDTMPTGSGSIDDSVSLPTGSSIVYTVVGTVSSAAMTAFTNFATLTPPNGLTQTAMDTVSPILLSITKTDSTLGTANPGSVLPGHSLTYTVTVTNTGPGSVSGAAVVDTFPPPFTGGTYTVQLNGGATDTMPTGSGSIDDSVSLPVGASIVYTVVGTVSSAAMTAFTNTASVTPPGGSTQTAMDTVKPILLSITKTDSTLGTVNPGSVLPGHSLTYTVTVTNTGPGSVSGAAVVDTFPPPFTGGTYTVQLNGGATDTMPTGSGSIDDSVSLPVGSSIVYTVVGTVSSAAMAAFTNSASVTPPGGSTQTAMDTVSPILLSITKTDSTLGTANPGSVLPGQALTYTVTVTNTGPGSVSGAAVMDAFPPQFTGGTYTVQLNGGATDTMPTGSGSIDDTVSLPTGSSIVYTVMGTVSSTATGSFTNTATVQPPGGTLLSAMDTNTVSTVSSLSGFVYVDTNNNGIKDAGELPITGVTVVLSTTVSGVTTVVSTTTTNSLGAYSFSNLPAGNYTITETQPTNFIDGKDAVGSQASGTIVQTSTTNAIESITLPLGTDGVNNNFGNLGLTPAFVSKRQYLSPPQPVNLAAVQSLSGYAFSETTAGSAAFDPASPAAGEAALAGVTITLSGPSGTQTTTTSADGSYSFTSLQPGSYTLSEQTAPTNFTIGTALVGSQNTGTAGTGTISNIILNSNTSGVNNDFPNLPVANTDTNTPAVKTNVTNTPAVVTAAKTTGTSSTGTSSGSTALNPSAVDLALKNLMLGRA